MSEKYTNPNPRPQPGSVTIHEKRIPICPECGYALSDTGMRSYDCPLDGDPHPTRIDAVYECTMKFIRDEVVDQYP